MPTFDFVAGPEGATPKQAFAALQQHLSGQRDSGDWWRNDPIAASGQTTSARVPEGYVQDEPLAPKLLSDAEVGLTARARGAVPEGVVRAAATGVPIVGGLANKLDAATNAPLAPVVTVSCRTASKSSPSRCSASATSTRSISRIGRTRSSLRSI
jgi:hypothetical protein